MPLPWLLSDDTACAPHVSDPDSREEFRRVSYIRAACAATIRGYGLQGYVEALRFLCGADA